MQLTSRHLHLKIYLPIRISFVPLPSSNIPFLDLTPHKSIMSPKIDPAILQALSLSPATTTLTSHGGSGFSSTYKLTSKGSDGEEKLYFVKTGGVGSEVMFAGTFYYCFTCSKVSLSLSRTRSWLEVGREGSNHVLFTNIRWN